MSYNFFCSSFHNFGFVFVLIFYFCLNISSFHLDRLWLLSGLFYVLLATTTIAVIVWGLSSICVSTSAITSGGTKKFHINKKTNKKLPWKLEWYYGMVELGLSVHWKQALSCRSVYWIVTKNRFINCVQHIHKFINSIVFIYYFFLFLFFLFR